MTPEDKTKRYEERHRFWTDKAFSQLSLSIELLFTLSVAVLGFVLDKADNYNDFCWCSSNCIFSWKMTAFFISISSIVVSLTFGLLGMISRNLDLRITRHITLLRKKNHANIKGETSLTDSCFCFFGLMRIFFCGYQNIEHGEYGNSDFMTRFNKLRWTAKCLGKLTWRYNGGQLITLFTGIVFYVFAQLIN
jgi:hypothetical protein